MPLPGCNYNNMSCCLAALANHLHNNFVDHGTLWPKTKLMEHNLNELLEQKVTKFQAQFLEKAFFPDSVGIEIPSKSHPPPRKKFSGKYSRNNSWVCLCCLRKLGLVFVLTVEIRSRLSCLWWKVGVVFSTYGHPPAWKSDLVFFTYGSPTVSEEDEP